MHTISPDPISTVLTSIIKLRAKEKLTDKEITTIVNGYTDGIIPDYQMSAWLATCAAMGLSLPETIALTRSYVDSGVQLQFEQSLHPIVDKHSTGGIGDKTTLVIAPIVAACGVSLCKMTGRGLGITGGTVDKLEAISGMNMQLSAEQLHKQLANIGIVVTGQSDDLVPADKAIYALRDVTATVDSLPLIAASVMSKKIASTADHIVLDVKYGAGAVMPTHDSARELSQLMLEIATSFELSCSIYISNMEMPLGKTIGNALEVKEAVNILQNKDSDERYRDFCLAVAATLIIGAKNLDHDSAYHEVITALESGAAYERFGQWITAQGGNLAEILEPNWQQAPYRYTITSSGQGWITSINARILGQIALELGAGRKTKSAHIDHRVGLWLDCAIGNYRKKNESLITVHSNREFNIATLSDRIIPAFIFSDSPSVVHPIIVENLSNCRKSQ